MVFVRDCCEENCPEQLTKYDILRKITAFKDQWSKDCFLKELSIVYLSFLV